MKNRAEQYEAIARTASTMLSETGRCMSNLDQAIETETSIPMYVLDALDGVRAGLAGADAVEIAVRLNSELSDTPPTPTIWKYERLDGGVQGVGPTFFDALGLAISTSRGAFRFIVEKGFGHVPEELVGKWINVTSERPKTPKAKR